MPNNVPLSIALESARGKLVSAVNQVIADTQLPAYLLEGVVLEILADLRNRKNMELMIDYAAMRNNEKKE